MVRRQHIGAACEPVVKVGDTVSVGDVVGQVPAKALGAPIHASIDGVVRQVSAEAVTIEAN